MRNILSQKNVLCQLVHSNSIDPSVNQQQPEHYFGLRSLMCFGINSISSQPNQRQPTKYGDELNQKILIFWGVLALISDSNLVADMLEKGSGSMHPNLGIFQ